MKILAILGLLFQTAAFADEDIMIRNYSCFSRDAIDNFYPERFWFTMEGEWIGLTDQATDLVYTGHRNDNIAKGFKGLGFDQDAYVKVTSSVFKDKNQAFLIFVDNSRDAREVVYVCNKI